VSDPNLLYSDVEEALRASLRDLLTGQAGFAAVLARIETSESYDRKLWRTLAADLGLAGLPVPESLGGQGASVREVAVVMEELGRSLAPVPFLGSAVLATAALLAAGDRELLPRLASGELVGALAIPLTTAPGGAAVNSAFAAVHADDDALTGTVRSVADAPAADVLIVPATGPSGPGLYAVEQSRASVTELARLDLTRRLGYVTLAGTQARLIAGAGGSAVAAVRSAVTTAAGLLAAEQVGLAQWCLDETVAYLRQRYQFGRPLGSFQALKHRLADLYTEVVSARAAARSAGDALAAGSGDAPIAVGIAQCTCSAVAVHAAEEAVQLHGGIGMTWEHPAHLYLKRAKSDELALGTPGRHRALLAELVNLPPA
jgi:alkylation response protein AidB-like acyl-CoA dehydrogenase